MLYWKERERALVMITTVSYRVILGWCIYVYLLVDSVALLYSNAFQTSCDIGLLAFPKYQTTNHVTRYIEAL